MSKKAIVTGASSGIGLAFAERLAAEGYAVTVVARSQDKLDALVRKLGPAHRALVADLSNADDLTRVAADIRASRYDLLINNAGVGHYGLFGEQPLDTHLNIMRLNTTSIVTLAHAFLEAPPPKAALLNVSSLVGRLAFPGATIYTATKAFITSFSEGLWWENKGRDIYVAALVPGATKTGFHLAARGAADREAPKALTQTSEQVVEEAMQALARRSEPVIVSGLVNRVMLFVNNRLIPRKSMIEMMAKQVPLERV